MNMQALEYENIWKPCMFKLVFKNLHFMFLLEMYIIK